MVELDAFMAELRPRIPDTEKITINLGYVDLGQVDLMVQEGFYSVDRYTGALADRADADVTVIDVPAFSVRVVSAAAGEAWHPP
jgi:hypothetical protein